MTGRQRYELLEELVLDLCLGAGVVGVCVPKGYVTDLASTPRIVWPIFPPFGQHQRAAIVHDYLYSRHARCSRFLADSLFREAMAALGVPLWRRVVMYYAVRLFGWAAFRRERPNVPEPNPDWVCPAEAATDLSEEE